MDILSWAISSLSDIVIICEQVLVLSFISSRGISRKRFAVACAVLLASGVLLNGFLTYTSGAVSILLLLPLIVLRLPPLAMFAVKSYSRRNILILLIIQFFCSTLLSMVRTVLQEVIMVIPYVHEAAMLAVFTAVFAITSAAVKRMKKLQLVVRGVFTVIPTPIYIMMLLTIFIENGLMEFMRLDSAKATIQLKFERVFLLLLNICTAVLMICLIIHIAYQRYYEQLNNVLSRQVEIQLSHYEKRERIDTEIRRFKHDYVNHIKCLRSMLEAEKYSDAEDYLEKISGALPAGGFLFRTGNYIADAILTERQESSAEDNVTVRFGGCIPQDIDSADLCTILSNALDNAAEAAEKLPGEKVITVYGNYQQEHFVLIVKNPTADKRYFKDVFPPTTKLNKEGHGFGLSNIQYIVNKYGGTLHTLLEEGEFTLSLVFCNTLDGENRERRKKR